MYVYSVYLEPDNGRKKRLIYENVDLPVNPAGKQRAAYENIPPVAEPPTDVGPSVSNTSAMVPSSDGKKKQSHTTV